MLRITINSTLAVSEIPDISKTCQLCLHFIDLSEI
jgi:hypothetical protein